MQTQQSDVAAARKSAHRVRGSKDPRSSLSAQRQSLSDSSYGHFIRTIKSNPFGASRALPRPYPSTPAQLHAFKLLSPLDDARELLWTAELIGQEGAKLTQFAALRDSFERALLTDDLSECSAVLDTIEARFGVSLWLFSRRIHVLQWSLGLEAQKQFTEQITSTTRRGSMAAYMAFFFSVRSEPTVTPPRLRAQLDKSLGSFHSSPQLASYARFHVLGIMPPADRVGDTLRYEQTGPIIDCYDTFLALSAALIMEEEVSASVRRAIDRLTHDIHDCRLDVLAALLAEDAPRRMSFVDAFDSAGAAQLLGQHEVAVASADTLLDTYPTEPDVAALFARAAAIVGGVGVGGNLSRRTAGRMAQLMSGGPGAVDDFAELGKLGILLHTSPFGCAVLSVLEDETSPTVPLRQHAYLRSGAFLSSTPSPFWIEMQPFGRIREFTALGSYVQFGDTIVGTRGAALAEATDELDPIVSDFSSTERDLIVSLKHLSAGDAASAIVPARRLSRATSGYFRRRGHRILITALLASDSVDQAIMEITSACTGEPAWNAILPIASTTDALRSGRASLPPTELSLPILFDMYAQHVDASRDTERVFAYSDLLEGFGVARPSQLAVRALELDTAKLIYFLRYICVESVMDRTLGFDSSRAVLEERLAVCRVLLTVDAANADTYHDEIKTIAKRLLLSRRIRELEQSKIYVDIDNLRRRLEPELKESYSRYVALRRERPLAGERQFREALLQSESGTLEKVVLLRLPKNEITDIFATIVNRFSDEYTTSPEYGLDKYLSVRIRHGTLAAHLRRPVEAAHLVTQRDARTNKYRVNEYWRSRLSTPAEIAAAIAQRLAAFSEAFDALVDEVKSWIHVSTDANGAGLFDFVLTEASFLGLAHIIGVDTPYEGFVDHMVSFFDQLLDKRLEEVRERLDNDAKRRASALLEQLAIDIEHIGGSACGELAHAIRTGNNEMQVAFDRVATWFRRTSSSGAEPFSISEAIDIGIESVKTIDPQFQSDVDIDFDGDLDLHGSLLTPFVDVLFIMFENVTKHSGAVVHPHAHISATLRGMSLRIRVSNPLGLDVVPAGVEERLERLKSEVLDRSHIAFVRREGGSGFHKLARILQDDIGGQPQLDFGFVGREFFVELSLPIRMMPYEDSSSRRRREQAVTGDGPAEGAVSRQSS